MTHSKTIATIKFYLAAVINYVVAAIPWALALDWVTKLVTLIIAVAGFLYMRKRHLQDMRNKKLDEENKLLLRDNLMQEQYQLLAKNKLLDAVNEAEKKSSEE